MARVIRFLNLGAGGDPKAFAVDTIPGGNGDLGGFYEDNSMNAFQLFQLVDSTAVANDVEYVKSYSAAFLATPTVGNSSRNEVAGVACTTVAANQYTLLQQRGVRLVKYTGTAALTAARGSRVFPDSVGANSVDVANIGTAIVLAGNQNVNSIGVAQAAATGGNISTYLHINPY
jgi:hypothetical protein